MYICCTSILAVVTRVGYCFFIVILLLAIDNLFAMFVDLDKGIYVGTDIGLKSAKLFSGTPSEMDGTCVFGSPLEMVFMGGGTVVCRWLEGG